MYKSYDREQRTRHGVETKCTRWVCCSETSRGRYEEVQQQISLSYETKVIEPVGDEEFPRGINGAGAKLTWSLHTNNQDTFPQLNNEVVNLTDLL